MRCVNVCSEIKLNPSNQKFDTLIYFLIDIYIGCIVQSNQTGRVVQSQQKGEVKTITGKKNKI